MAKMILAAFGNLLRSEVMEQPEPLPFEVCVPVLRGTSTTIARFRWRGKDEFSHYQERIRIYDLLNGEDFTNEPQSGI